MKKYLSGIIAVIIAVGAVAFTMPDQASSMVTFTYTPPSNDDYRQSSVQDKDNWGLGLDCSSGVNRACSFQVLPEDTQSSGTELGPNVSIIAEEGQVAEKYLVIGGNQISAIHNKN